MAMNWGMATNLLGLAVGTSMGMILFSIAYHSSQLTHSVTFSIAQGDANFSFSNRIGQGNPNGIRQMNLEEGGHDDFVDTLYFQNDTDTHKDIDVIAKFLYNNIKIVCMVILDEKTTMDATFLRSSRLLLEKRCNKLFYFSLYKTNSSNIIYVKPSSIGGDVISAANEALRYIAKNYINTADWFIRVDLQGYVIMENLRYFLSSVHPEDPLYFGPLSRNVYGEPGFCSAFVLSRKALESLANALSPSSKNTSDSKACLLTQRKELSDALKCFRKLGLQTKDTTDKLGRSRFHCFHPMIEINRNYPSWFTKTNSDYTQNITGVSDYAISFGNMDIKRQLGLEFYIYHLTAAGIDFGREDINR